MALKEGKHPDAKSAPELALREVPFPPEAGVSAPSTPSAPCTKGVYITVERILRFKETGGCKGCIGESVKHSDACRARFAKLVEEEKEEARKASASEGAAPSAPKQLAPGERMLGLPEDFQAERVAEFDRDFDEAMAAPPPPVEEPVLVEDDVAPSPFTSAVISGVAITPHTASRTPPLHRSNFLPEFGVTIPACMAGSSQPSSKKKSNRRSKRAAIKRTMPGTHSTMFEFACAADSQK